MDINAIILAGGKSSRMGRDKALISIQAVPMLQRVYQVATSCADTVYVVTPWQERYQHLLPRNCNFIRETILGQGPLMGFCQALKQVQSDWVLLLACDLPKLQIEIIQEWKLLLNMVDDQAIAALVYSDTGWEPLCGFYHRRCLPKLIEFINQGGRSFQEWLSLHPVYTLPLAEPQMLFNCNTPEDLGLAIGEVEI
jgi:molybdopterin-guanine dinucleotide biosynthesis protein A